MKSKSNILKPKPERRGLLLPLRGLADISVSKKSLLHHIRSFSRLKTCNNVFEIELFPDHPDDTSIRVTADDVNFVTNAEYVYCMLSKEKKGNNIKQQQKCYESTSLSYTHPHFGTHTSARARTHL